MHSHERDWAWTATALHFLAQARAWDGSPFGILGGAAGAVDLTGSEDVSQSLHLLWSLAGARSSHALHIADRCML